MLIDSIYYFRFTQKLNYYDSIRDFRSEEMTFINLALSTPEFKVNSTPTEFAINEYGSNIIREYVISRLEQLKEISKTLADNSPKYIRINCSDNTTHYYAYNEDFCHIFQIANDHKIKEKIKINVTADSLCNMALNKAPAYYINSPTTATTPPPEPRKQKTSSLRKLIFIISIILLVIGAITIHIANSSDNESTPIAEPRSGTILTGSEVFNESEITIHAASGNSCVVKLKNSFDVDLLSFYVRAGDTVTVGVPCKYMYVYFASGDNWYGKNLLFGENTTYQKVKDLKDFTVNTWEYTLYPIRNGNLSLTTLDPDEF